MSVVTGEDVTGQWSDEMAERDARIRRTGKTTD